MNDAAWSLIDCHILGSAPLLWAFLRYFLNSRIKRES